MEIQSKDELIKCPKCDFEQSAEDIECIRCGIVFEKFKARFKPEERREDDRDRNSEEELWKQEVDKKGWISILAGSVFGGLIFLFPFWAYVFRTFPILVHEFGHTLLGWLFGYPTIPAFDFVYGGGVAVHFDRKPGILILIYFLFVLLLYTLRKNRLSVLLIIGVILLYTFAAFTPIHEILTLFMGHGMELIFSAVFLYRAISGSSIVVPLERPLYAFVGFFTQFCNINFSYRLLTDNEFRFLYEQGKGGMIANDFVRIAQDYLNIKLNSIVYFFLFLSFTPPLIAFLAYRYLSYWVTSLNKLCNTECE